MDSPGEEIRVYEVGGDEELFQCLFREGAENIQALAEAHAKFQVLYDTYIIQSQMLLPEAIKAQFTRIEEAFTIFYSPLTRMEVPRTLPEATARVANSNHALSVILPAITSLVGLIEKELKEGRNGDKSQIGARIGARCIKLLPGIIRRHFTAKTLTEEDLQALIRECHECTNPLSDLLSRRVDQQMMQPRLQA